MTVLLAADAPPGIDYAQVVKDVVGQFVAELGPLEPWLAAAVVVVTVLRFPMLGRGPGVFASRDVWRLFKYDARRLVMERAGGRCEGPILLLWGRCRRPAQEADHVYPWSRGGATIATNGQALCHRCNRSKSNTRPAWWYILGLERRRRSYFPVSAEARVAASMTASDRTRRAAATVSAPGRHGRRGVTGR